MKEEIKDKWVKALRSGEYTQGRGNLHRDDKFCCLGVLCDLASKEINLLVEKDDWENVAYNGEEVLPPILVRDWAGFRKNNVGGSFIDVEGNKKDLWELNDCQNHDFNQIADVIETYWEKL